MVTMDAVAAIIAEDIKRKCKAGSNFSSFFMYDISKKMDSENRKFGVS